jgi:hypothetical protein
MKKFIVIILFALGLQAIPVAQTLILHTYLDGDYNSKVYEKKFYLVRSSEEWKKIKEASVVRSAEVLQTLATFDFSSKALLLYFAGDQCNGVEVSGITEDKNGIAIKINHLSYNPKCHDAALLVTPWMLISFKAKPGEKITLTDDVRIVNCD